MADAHDLDAPPVDTNRPPHPDDRAAAAAVPDWARGVHSALDDRLGLELLELGPQRVVGRMPVTGNTQPMGLWHGGASAVLVESLASFGAYAAAREHGRAAVGIDLSVTHHRAVRSGTVTGTATPIHTGRTITTWEVALTDDRDRRIASGRLTCALVDATD